MSAVFKTGGHTFVTHLEDPFQVAYLVTLMLPFGLTRKAGEILFSPHGTTLGWRFEGDEKFEVFAKDQYQHFRITTEQIPGQDFYAISGSTTHASRSDHWLLYHYVPDGSRGHRVAAEAERYRFLSAAVDSIPSPYKWVNLNILEADEAYRS